MDFGGRSGPGASQVRAELPLRPNQVGPEPCRRRPACMSPIKGWGELIISPLPASPQSWVSGGGVDWHGDGAGLEGRLLGKRQTQTLSGAAFFHAARGKNCLEEGSFLRRKGGREEVETGETNALIITPYKVVSI